MNVCTLISLEIGLGNCAALFLIFLFLVVKIVLGLLVNGQF